MARTCTVCQHPQRAEIDQALLAAEPYRGIALRFEASPHAVLRHKRHLPAAMVAAKDAEEAARGDDLLQQARDLQRRMLRILDAAEGAGTLDIALRAGREVRGCIELLGKLMGELDQRAQVNVNVLVHPEFRLVVAVIRRTLAPWPDAREALGEALATMEGRSGPGR